MTLKKNINLIVGPDAVLKAGLQIFINIFDITNFSFCYY